MKRLSILTMVLLTMQLQAQTTRGPLRVRTSQQLSQDSREAGQKLGAARNGVEVEQNRLEGARATDNAMADKARQAASDLLRAPNPAETAATKRADQSMAAAMKNVTAEGKALLAQGVARGPTSAPPRADVVKAEAAPKPKPLTPAPLDNPAVPGDKVIITCTGAAFFDSETSIMLFTDNVEVRHPQFFVLCDEFEVHMLKEEKSKPGAPAGKGDAIKDAAMESAKPAVSGASADAGKPATGADGQPGSDSNIKFAIARGRMVTIEKLTETGDIQVGHSKHATYDGATGNILLRDFPQVQRGQHLQIATDPATTMTLKQNGALDTKGPSRTEIVQEKPKSSSRLNAPPAPTVSPNPNRSPSQPRQ